MSQAQFRYPGVQPFGREQSDRFFGREDDIARFFSLVSQEKLCVLFGKSGYGKSSLLNAGIQPRLEAESAKGKRRYIAVPIRFLAASGQSEDNLFKQFDLALGSALQSAGVTEASTSVELPNTLWGRFKRWQTDPNTVFVLLFDQFEELFSYPPEQQQAFRQQLAELLYTEYPFFLEENEERLTAYQHQRLAEKVAVHAVLAIRADRLAELDRLKDQLPAILHKRFELRPLPRAEAEKALVEPASLTGMFASPNFKFEATATRKILDFLKDADGQVDPIQLQILAESFEKRVISEQIPAFHAHNTGDLKAIISHYYSDKIAAIHDASEQLAVRRLCEEGLAQETDPPIRLSLHAAQIRQFYGIEQTLLNRLVDARLLRAEAGKGGGVTYELPHDTLLGAVLEAKHVRLKEEKLAAEAKAAEELAQRLKEAEAKATEEKKRAEEAERLKIEAVEGRQKARMFSWLAAFVALLAISASWYAFIQSKKVLDKEEEVKTAERAVKSAQDTVALKTTETLAALSRAEQKEIEAKAALEAANKANGLADQKTKEAAKNYELAQTERKNAELATVKVVQDLLKNGETAIYGLNYDEANEFFHEALKLVDGKPDGSPLGNLKPVTARALLEIAYFHHHSGHDERAREPFDLAANLLGKPNLVGQMDFQKLDVGQDSILKGRYFPIMIKIKGGTETLGSDNVQPRHAVTLSSFEMAKTETTWWQYNLFCEATSTEKPEKPAGWGGEGNNPVIIVSWYEAVEYANWLSKKEGKDTAIAKVGENFSISLKSGGYHLPTEAQWEYAARAGQETEYAGSNGLNSVGWYSENSGSRTHAVARKQANKFGLYDMSGNVSEWCWDWYGNYGSSSMNDPSGPDSGAHRVTRGGSWDYWPAFCRSASRDHYRPSNHYNNVGFRLARQF